MRDYLRHLLSVAVRKDRRRLDIIQPMSSPSPTLAQLLAAVATDEQNFQSAQTAIANDETAVTNAQAQVTTAQTALTAAQTGLTTATTQLNTDSAALLAPALQLQSDVNALVTYLQAQGAGSASGS